MHRNPRRQVIRIDERPNTGPSAHLFPLCAAAVLACGHVLNLGVSRERPRTMACYECGAGRAALDKGA